MIRVSEWVRSMYHFYFSQVTKMCQDEICVHWQNHILSNQTFFVLFLFLKYSFHKSLYKINFGKKGKILFLSNRRCLFFFFSFSKFLFDGLFNQTLNLSLSRDNTNTYVVPDSNRNSNNPVKVIIIRTTKNEKIFWNCCAIIEEKDNPA